MTNEQIKCAATRHGDHIVTGKTHAECLRIACGFYDGVCELDPEKRIIHSLRQPSQLPECFMFSVIDSAFASVLELMDTIGVDFHGATRGWPTVVGRICARANRYGYIMPVRQRNLERYG